jgi:C4-dicarboxylate transporter DctQ subunit
MDDMGKAGTVGKRLSNVFDKILIGTGYTSGVIVVVMMLSVSFNVVMRYFFNKPTLWSNDFAGYMQYAAVLVGAAYVLMVKRHTRIDIVVQRLRPRAQVILHIVTWCIALVACAIFLWKGVQATWDAYQRNDILFRAVEVPLAPLYAFIPFSFLLLCIQFCREIYGRWRSL